MVSFTAYRRVVSVTAYRRVVSVTAYRRIVSVCGFSQQCTSEDICCLNMTKSLTILRPVRRSTYSEHFSHLHSLICFWHLRTLNKNRTKSSAYSASLIVLKGGLDLKFWEVGIVLRQVPKLAVGGAYVTHSGVLSFGEGSC